MMKAGCVPSRKDNLEVEQDVPMWFGVYHPHRHDINHTSLEHICPIAYNNPGRQIFLFFLACGYFLDFHSLTSISYK
jgi:hypothetical protein